MNQRVVASLTKFFPHASDLFAFIFSLPGREIVASLTANAVAPTRHPSLSLLHFTLYPWGEPLSLRSVT